jgi:hypothetical protein
MSPRSLQHVKLALVFLLLAASLPSFLAIPFMGPWPLDFQNLWAFHDCASRNAPYAASGFACGDAAGREMRYPPLLYWSFAWTRLLTFEAAGQVFTVVVAVGTALATAAWLPLSTRERPAGVLDGLFAGLLLAQFPLVFAVERGNNDVLPLLGWTAAAWLLASGRMAAAGALAGLSAVYKLYPAFACLVAGLGLAAEALRRAEARRGFALFTAGGGLAVLAGLVVVWPDSVVYFTETMPRIARLAPDPAHFAHPLRNLSPAWGGWALGAPLLLAWCAAAAWIFARDPMLVLAGGLAISTYFAGTSWDYNLITAYPLLVLLFRRAFLPGAGPQAYALLLLGLVAVVGHRGAFAAMPRGVWLHLALQWVFLMATALLAPRLAGPGGAAPAASPPGPAAA